MKVVVGHSKEVESSKVIQEVLGQIRTSLNERLPKAGILFCALGFNHALILSAIQEAFPEIELVILLLFAGAVDFSWAIKEGYSLMAGKEKVTYACKNVLYRISRHYICHVVTLKKQKHNLNNTTA